MIFGRGMKNKIVGSCGEDAACEYLKAHGCEIVERNMRTRCGEIDIIARDGGCLVFVEVKTRGSDSFGTPAEAVTYYKRRNIIRAAELYLMKNPTDSDIRFDVVEVYGRSVGGGFWLENVNRIVGAFEV